jgi:hypothetical protein
MARPKKAPRVRLQITLPKKTAKDLRGFARKLDRDISEVVDAAVRHVMDKYTELPDKSLVSPIVPSLAVEGFGPRR